MSCAENPVFRNEICSHPPSTIQSFILFDSSCENPAHQNGNSSYTELLKKIKINNRTD
jgi:hypothetical protein